MTALILVVCLFASVVATATGFGFGLVGVPLVVLGLPTRAEYSGIRCLGQC